MTPTNRCPQKYASHYFLRAIALMIAVWLLPTATAHAGIPVGACCVGSACQDNSGAGLDADTCTMTLGGVFQGNSTTCATTICTVPVMSQWGLLVMVLLTLTAGTLVLCRRKAVPWLEHRPY